MLSFQAISAQNYISNPNVEEKILEGSMLNQEALNLVGLFNDTNSRNTELNNNEIYIKQIGSYNLTNINITSKASDISVTQNGNANDVNLEYNVNTAISEIQQLGNRNSITDFVLDPSADISLDLIQNGNDLSFERQGVNDLTKSLKFRQNGFSQSLIVRSID
ncbi:hypothetical protein [Leeuwenhoekiella sp. MAR_2009_132]|uniref:hypothetical protein n=1 Tax=Leeuwenhoekiella sp. MAR_2009_132 TaxID=1392489 RepID=UPI00048A6813|nr:hypothetical protein [Leeuwenhoekiella sp. MAR_2009_132]